MSFQDFLDQAQTGDVVIFTGTSPVSLLVESLSVGFFSHTAMVVVQPGTGEKFLWQTVSEVLQPDPLYPPPNPTPPGTAHSGAQLGALKPTMIQVVDFHDAPTWRQLQYDRPQGFDQQVWDAVSQLDNRPFPDLPILGANYISGYYLDEAVNDGPMFCSQLVTYTLQHVGLIDSARPANSVAPSDYSSEVRPRPVVPLLGQFLPDRAIQLAPSS